MISQKVVGTCLHLRAIEERSHESWYSTAEGLSSASVEVEVVFVG